MKRHFKFKYSPRYITLNVVDVGVKNFVCVLYFDVAGQLFVVVVNWLLFVDVIVVW